MGVALVGALVISLLTTFFLPVVYKSTAVFYPIRPDNDAASASVEDLDRMITIGTSEPIARAIVQRFDLTKHYNASSPDAAAGQFASNLSIVHTERDALELSFKDQDKQLAANVANAVIKLIDSESYELAHQGHQQALLIYRKQYPALRNKYNRLHSNLLQARFQYGIYGLPDEARYLVREIITTESKLRQAEGSGASAATVAGLRRALRGLTRSEGGNTFNLEGYVRGRDSLNVIQFQADTVQQRLTKMQVEYDAAQFALRKRKTAVYVVQPAYPSEQKASPKRGLIVGASVFITFIASVVLILLLELYQANRHRLQLR